jgi:serine/threonine protein kinase
MAAHRASILHRDLKPENLLICGPLASEPLVNSRFRPGQDSRSDFMDPEITSRRHGTFGYRRSWPVKMSTSAPTSTPSASSRSRP